MSIPSYSRRAPDRQGTRGGRQSRQVQRPEGRKGACWPRLSGAHGRNLRGMPPRAEAQRHYDPDVHPQGDRRVGRTDEGADGAGFTITASWPINTEAEGSLHIKDKAAANSTIFLACRPRATMPRDAEAQLLGRCRTTGCAGRPHARRRVPGGRHPRRRSLPRFLRSGTGGVFATLAAEARHAAHANPRAATP